MTKEEMQERLIDFAVAVSEIVEGLPEKRYRIYLSSQSQSIILIQKKQNE